MRHFFKKLFGNEVGEKSVSYLVFKVFFSLFLFLFFIEAIFPGFVVNWINPVWFLFIAIIAILINNIENKL